MTGDGLALVALRLAGRPAITVYFAARQQLAGRLTADHVDSGAGTIGRVRFLPLGDRFRIMPLGDLDAADLAPNELHLLGVVRDDDGDRVQPSQGGTR